MEFIVLSLLEYYLFSFGLSATKRLVSHKLILKTGIIMNTLRFQQSCSQGSLLLVPRVSFVLILKRVTREQNWFLSRGKRKLVAFHIRFVLTTGELLQVKSKKHQK